MGSMYLCMLSEALLTGLRYASCSVIVTWHVVAAA
jgi:formate dehydrogenase maturation protein FdhE